MVQPKKRFPYSILILAAIATVFGFGMGLIIVSGHSTADNPVIVIPTSDVHQLAVGSPAPDFALRTFSGQTVSLKDLRGKRVLINFWASWCGPCQRETPDLQSAYNQLRGQNVVFVGIGTQDETANLKKFVDDNRVTYTIIEDPLGKVGDTYGVLGLPTTVLIDSNGVVRKVFTGEVKQDQVVEELKKLS